MPRPPVHLVRPAVLREAGLPLPNGAAGAAVEAAFPLLAAMLDVVARQVDVVLGGI
ncbi:MAG TPA: hypothetical protein VGD56_19295 [Gemmatirosa sp.]